MTSPITAILVNDVAIDLGAVEYDVSISHGRNDIKSTPEASSTQITLRGDVGLALEIADEIRIGAYGNCRFRGNITDLQVTHLSTDNPIPITTITAIGFLAKLGTLTTGESGYDSEYVNQRVQTVMDTTGLDYLNGADSTLELLANSDPGVQPVLSYLQALAEWSGGTYFDDCRGRIIFEDYGNRGIAANPGIWENLTETWSFYTAAWDSFPTDNGAMEIPANATVFTPTWTKNLVSLINDIEIEYGNNNLYELTDTASIDRYGRRAYDLVTELKKESDAQARAEQILTAQSQPLWSMGQITILMDRLTTTKRDEVLTLLNGARVIINGLPADSPLPQFQGIVEGWTETYVPGQHNLTLSISDPRYSYQTCTWAQIDTALTWANVNATLAWYNAVNADDLLAA